jgi:hypothetical protein
MSVSIVLLVQGVVIDADKPGLELEAQRIADMLQHQVAVIESGHGRTGSPIEVVVMASPQPKT